MLLRITLTSYAHCISGHKSCLTQADAPLHENYAIMQRVTGHYNNSQEVNKSRLCQKSQAYFQKQQNIFSMFSGIIKWNKNPNK